MAPKLSGILIKTAGVGSLGLGVYDAHSRARREAIREGKNRMADRGLNAWMNTTRLEVESDVEAGLRNEARDIMMDSPFPKICGNIKGYVKGFLSSVADNVVPITLGATALMSKAGGFVSKCSAWGMGIYAVYKGIRAFTPSARTRNVP